MAAACVRTRRRRRRRHLRIWRRCPCWRPSGRCSLDPAGRRPSGRSPLDPAGRRRFLLSSATSSPFPHPLGSACLATRSTVAESGDGGRSRSNSNILR
ncbi:hypothetical protein ACP70R_048665 [Stipagrostis hirtigluma subsp. patula]